jgi:methylated-DNA-[protein]-cysteine S-methyltransferase
MRYVTRLTTPVGEMWLVQEGEALVALRLPGEAAPEGELRETPLLKEAAAQIKDYFAGLRATFDLPLKPEGTEFRKAVWDALQKIPAGKTASYGEIARTIGKPKASRAVGSANHFNPLPLIIPCHRVIGSGGNMVGYGGGLELKRKLLDLESQFYRGQGDC